MTDTAQPLAQRHVLWLVLSLVMVAAPHALRLPWWLIALFATLAAWRVYIGHVRIPLPNRWLLLLIVIAATAGVYLGYRTLFGRDAGVALLVAMLGLKLLETRSLRDAMLLIFLGYFLVITNFFYSQTMLTAFYLLASVWMITATMVGLHYARTEPPLRVQLRTAGVLLAQSAPLMLVLFVLFPRVPGPLWGMPQDASTGVSGLSDTMTPGSIANLILSDAVAFRVKFESEIPRAKDLYWRGPVLWDFDGRTWTAPRFLYGKPEFDPGGKPVRYEVTIEPHYKRWLFALDLPGRVPPRAHSGSDFQLLAFAPVNSRQRYDMVSYLNSTYGVRESRFALRRALALPDGFNPRSVELARSLRREFPDDKALIREVLRRFNTQGFSYTLSPPLLGTNSVDEFLFEVRSGFCEIYASSFAVLMRAAGIPTRIVTGYQGGEINPMGGYMIVRQAFAHAWNEVWIEGEGWKRVDPTAAVSPLRVESGIAAAAARSDPLPLLVRGDFALLRELQMTLDLFTNSWNQWVLGYTPERQRLLLAGVGMDDATWQKMAAALLIVTGAIVAVLAMLMLRRLNARVRDPVKIAYLRFCDKLRRKGLPRGPAEGPGDYARRIEQSRPDLTPAIAAITRLYVALRYGAQTGADRVSELRRLVRQFSA